ncbi:MAG: DUF169 domain-containing protein [Candidatus Zixiibacteriota bacterium]|nr:MAG: DUF169 domain-containing protein [candidate division Zixibacteria bacterium]
MVDNVIEIRVYCDNTGGYVLKEVDEAVAKYIRPDSFPLAIRMVKEGEELSERTRRPRRDMQIQVAVCQTLSMSRRYGWQIAVGEEDINCPLALTAFGFKEETEVFNCGEMCAGMYTETKSAGARTEAAVPKFSFDRYKYILTAPIARADFQPNLYLVYGNSAQIMRLMTAVLYRKGGYLTSKFAGRLDCADICIETMKTGQAQIILPCYGDRVFGQTQDHEMAMTLPVGIEEDLLAGFEGTHRGGIRYPVPSFLRYKPEYPKHYYKLFDAWEKGETSDNE